jgi:hypothetical protein
MVLPSVRLSCRHSFPDLSVELDQQGYLTVKPSSVNIFFWNLMENYLSYLSCGSWKQTPNLNATIIG